jgi:hypothetical protein
METLIEAQAVSVFRNDNSIAERYYRYLAAAIRQNVSAIRAGRAATPIQLFPQWLGWSESERTSNWASNELGALRGRGIDSALMFILAHEIAHHVHGHKPYRDKSITQARADESQADRFALETLARAGENPAAAMPLTLLWILIGNNAVEQEAMSTHPADERRLVAVMDFIGAHMMNDQAFQRYLDANGLRERWERAQDASRAESSDK